jgi:hypothetical protein
MAADPVLEYQNALRRLKAAKERGNRMVEAVTEAAKLFEGHHWTKVGVVGLTGGVHDGGVGRSRALDPERWPSGQQITEVILEYRNARAAAEVAWKSVPLERQIGLHSPEKFDSLPPPGHGNV